MLIAAYAVLVLEQLMRGWLGTWAGVSWTGFGVTELFTPVVRQQGSPATPLGWLVMMAAGPVALTAAGLVVYAVVNVFRASGIARSLALSFAVACALLLPAQLFAAAMPAGHGAVAELYAALGNPRAGRWGAAALALLLLWLLAGPLSRRAVATGRSWMRADAREFRRRLVRVVAGYPAMVAVFLIATALGWMALPWAALWSAMVLVALMLRTA